MAGGKPVRPGCSSRSSRRSGSGSVISSPSTPRPVGAVPDHLLLGLAEPDGEELLEPGAGSVEDPEGRVAGTDEGAGLLDQVAQEDRPSRRRR